MTAIHETGYPRIRSNLSDAELQELYTPTPSDREFARRATKSVGTELGVRKGSDSANANLKRSFSFTVVPLG